MKIIAIITQECEFLFGKINSVIETVYLLYMHVYKGAILEIFAICREACDVDVFLDSETEFQSVATSYLFPTLKMT
jgi:hypothetical protein